MNGIPAGAEGVDVNALLHDMVSLSADGHVKPGEELQHHMALSLAQFAAIPVGQVLGQAEMQDLIGRLLALPTPAYTPDGKQVLRVLSEEDTEKMF